MLDQQMQKAGVLSLLPSDPQSNWVRGGEPGWLYPPQARVIPVLMQDQCQKYVVIDETGWDGFQPVDHQLVGVFETQQEAWEKANNLVG